jgi:hypothetical protein
MWWAEGTQLQSNEQKTGSRQPPTVAVVITTYNHARFLGDAIESVLAQLNPADQIIVVDDGSEDHPDAVVALYPTVKLLRQMNQGLSAARNSGLHVVSEDKVIFLDADDRLLPEAISSGLTCFESAPNCGFVYGGHRRIGPDGKPNGRDLYTPVSPQPYCDFLRSNPIGMHGCVMYDRQRLIESEAFNPLLRRCEDYDVFLRMSRAYPVASHPTIIAEYRWHGSNMSADHREMLASTLNVHQQEASNALTHPMTAAAWRKGRQVWKKYYAVQALLAGFSGTSNSREIIRAAQKILQAVRMSPRGVAQHLLAQARTHLASCLPSDVRYQLKRRVRSVGKRYAPDP